MIKMIRLSLGLRIFAIIPPSQASYAKKMRNPIVKCGYYYRLRDDGNLHIPVSTVRWLVQSGVHGNHGKKPRKARKKLRFYYGANRCVPFSSAPSVYLEFG